MYAQPLNSSSDRLIIIVSTCHKLPTPWGSKSLLTRQFFLPFLLFDQWCFTCSGEAEMKALQRSRQAHFLVASSPDTFPPESFALRHLRTTQRRVCSQDSLSETRSIPDHFMWGDPLPGFSASYIETCYCSMLPACSRLSKVG